MRKSATAAALLSAAALTLAATAAAACGARGDAQNRVADAGRGGRRTMNDNTSPAGGTGTPTPAGPDAPTPAGTDAAAPREAAPNPAADNPTLAGKAQLDFSADVRREADGRFVVEYRVTNRGPRAVLLVNRGDTETGLGAGRVYVEPMPDGTVQFTQRGYLLPPDQGPGTTGAVYPGVSELAPGKTASETLKVGAPKGRQHPYGRLYPNHPVPNPVRRVRFCLGVINTPDAPTKMTRGTRVLTSFQSIAAQEVLCSEARELD